MKLRTIVAATSAALFSLGAIAGGEDKQSQSQQSQPSSSAASGSTSGQQSQKQAQRSDIVKQAQQKLSAAGHKVGKPDGILGPQTQKGLKEFQQSKGLEPSGQLNKETLAALGVSAEVTTGSAATGASSSGQAQSSGSAGASTGQKSKY